MHATVVSIYLFYFIFELNYVYDPLCPLPYLPAFHWLLSVCFCFHPLTPLSAISIATTNMNAKIKKKLKAACFKYEKEATNHSPPEQTDMYQLSFDVDGVDMFRPERFVDTQKRGILQRPEIVRKMKDCLLDPKNQLLGLFVKGPQGIGKSHSIVNLVQTLRADGHIVTFIPDCEKWTDDRGLIQAICRSIGTTMSALGMTSAAISQINVLL